MESTLTAPRVITVNPDSPAAYVRTARRIVQDMAPDTLTLSLEERRHLARHLGREEYLLIFRGVYGWQRGRANEFARALAVRRFGVSRFVLVRETGPLSLYPGDLVLCDHDGGRPLIFGSRGKAWWYFVQERKARGADIPRSSFKVRPPSREDLRKAGILLD